MRLRLGQKVRLAGPYVRTDIEDAIVVGKLVTKIGVIEYTLKVTYNSGGARLPMTMRN
jgi:hypothetical protein